jgi:glycogen operon protein
MLLMGDELGRTQHGNNNAYCQDNEISWVNWSVIDQPLLEYTRWLIGLRLRHPMFRRRRFFQGRPIRGAMDIAWFKPDGKPMTDQDWVARHARSLGVFLNGKAIPGHDEHGKPIVDDSFVLLFNGNSRSVYWTMPQEHGGDWRLVLDTDRLEPEAEPRPAPERILTRARTVTAMVSSIQPQG